MRPGIWRAIRRGDDRQTILAVDFLQVRSAPGFEELATNCPAGTEVWQIDEDFWLQPLSLGGTGSDRPAGALVDVLFSAVSGLDESRRVIAVMGYCAGASLACALAERIAESGQPAPPVVLFDPFEVGEAVMRYGLHSAMESFTPDLDADALKQLEATVDQPASDATAGGDIVLVSDADPWTADLTNLAGRIARAYDGLMSLAAESLDLPSGLVEELNDAFVGYLRYLVVCGSSPTGYGRGRVFQVLSESLEPLALPDFRELRFAVALGELLGDQAVAQGVLAALGSDYGAA